MTVMNYLDFDLLINRTETGYSVRVLRAPTDADRAVGEFRLPFSDTEIENFLLKIGRPRRIVRRLETPQTEEAKRFGGRLFESVFGEEVRVCLRKSLELANRQDAGLRVRLHLSGAPALADLPWEYLYDTSLNRFLALSSETPVVRYLELPESVRPLRVPPPLRVLVMISSPADYPRLDVDREWAKISEALADVQGLGLVVAERLEEATLPALQRKLRRGTYHIFHFIGHGGFDEHAQDGVLLLEEGETRRGRAVTGQDLGVLLRDHRPLRLVILNACEGARASRTDPFAGAAQSIVQQGIPAVIAMQFEISDDAAIAFSHEFYGALVDEYPVDAALAEARKGIYAKATDLEWGTPVLYLRAPDGYIFNLATREKAAPVHGHIATAPITPQPTAKPKPATAPPAIEPASGKPAQTPPRPPARKALAAEPPVDVEALYTEALAHFYTDDWTGAVALLQEVVAHAPAYGGAAGKLEEARRQQALAEQYAQGKKAYEAQAWAVAVENLDAVIALDAGYRDAAVLLAEATRQKELAELYDEARRLFQAQVWQAVVNVFERIRSQDPAYPDPEGMLATAEETLTRQERERRLSEMYRQAVRDMDAGRHADAQKGLEGIAAEASGYKQTDALLVRVRKAVADREAEQRTEAERQARLAELYRQAEAQLANREWSRAAELLAQITASEPGYRDAGERLAEARQQLALAEQFRQGLDHFDAGRWVQAIQAFRGVLQLDPGYADRVRGRATDLLLQANRRKEMAELPRPPAPKPGSSDETVAKPGRKPKYLPK